MKQVVLGRSGISVSRLCFGTLVFSPLQERLDPAAGADLLAEAFHKGINFIDTAEIYGTYEPIRLVRRRLPDPSRLVVATKCYAYDAAGAHAAFDHARKAMDMDVLDIMLLHEQESEWTLKGHREALETFLDYKARGLLKAVGISTHCVRAARACIGRQDIDIIHPLVNRQGLGIMDGAIGDMLELLKVLHEEGKGIYSMKALGGGNLMGSYRESMRYVLQIPFIHAVAVGMKTTTELEANIRFFEDGVLEESLEASIQKIPRKLHIDGWCSGCGACVRRCRQKALSLQPVPGGGKKAFCDPERCLLCGYCAGVCRDFAIKIF